MARSVFLENGLGAHGFIVLWARSIFDAWIVNPIYNHAENSADFTQYPPSSDNALS